MTCGLVRARDPVRRHHRPRRGRGGPCARHPRRAALCYRRREPRKNLSAFGSTRKLAGRRYWTSIFFTARAVCPAFFRAIAFRSSIAAAKVPLPRAIDGEQPLPGALTTNLRVLSAAVRAGPANAPAAGTRVALDETAPEGQACTDGLHTIDEGTSPRAGAANPPLRLTERAAPRLDASEL